MLKVGENDYNILLFIVLINHNLTLGILFQTWCKQYSYYVIQVSKRFLVTYFGVGFSKS